MANDISTNPWILDTVTTKPLLPSTTFVDHYEFLGLTPADAVVVKNAAGKEVWKSGSLGDGTPSVSGVIGPVHGGLYVSAITAGAVLRVFIK
jgi:hypothetical protein